MANSTLNKWLAQREEKLKEGTKAGMEKPGIGELDDGTYFGLYTVHEFGESQNDNIGVKTCFKVLEGENAGENIWLWEDLDRDRAMEFFVQKLRNSGVELSDESDVFDELKNNPADLFNLCRDKVVVKLVLKTKRAENGNDYQNKFIQKRMVDYEIPAAFLNGDNKPQVPDDQKAEAEDSGNAEPEEEEGVELSVGMTIKFKKGNLQLEGEITDLNESDGILKVKVGDNEHEIGIDAFLGIVGDEVV